MRKDMKKGQNAYEFLTTYGMMILIVVMVVGFYALLNVATYGRVIPETCNFASGFECSDFVVTTGAAVVNLENGFDDDVYVNSLTVIGDDGSECTVPVTGFIGKGETKQFVVSGCDNGGIDSKFNGIVRINYGIDGDNFVQVGELSTRIDPNAVTTTSSVGTTSTSSTSTSVTTTTSTSVTTTSTTSSTTTSSTSTTSTVIPGTKYKKKLIPTVAIDRWYIEQISPDAGSNDGTIDLDNSDARWFTNDGENINATAWNATIPSSTINNVTASCEIAAINTRPGNIEFSFNTGSGWSSWICGQTSTVSAFECNLYVNGVDTVAEVNSLKLRCRFLQTVGGGAQGFSLDHMNLTVGYTV